MELGSVKDVFDRVTKKQKLSSSKAQEMIDQISHEIETVLESLQLVNNTDQVLDSKTVLNELKASLLKISPIGQMESIQKELNVALSKYGKHLEKNFPDISKAYRNTNFDISTLNKIIANHFYRQGLFDVGDHFLSAVGEPESAASMKSPFLEMYQILQAMQNQNLEPALNWAATNSDKLAQSGSDIVLKLHSMQFVKLLQNGGSRDEALHYARTYLSPFATSHIAEVQKLMACLLWPGKIEKSPYHALLSPSNWDRLAEELKRQFCNLLGQSYNSPLSVTVAAGIQVLPALLKFMIVMKQEWQSMSQLPVPIEMDSEFQFHSVFVCPVSKEQATEENPPMLMSCGHVLCKQSILKMSKNSTKVFKCPYCPFDIDAAQCKQLYL